MKKIALLGVAMTLAASPESDASNLSGPIHFQIGPVINDYTISGEWFPDKGSASLKCLAGPAIFSFSSNKTGAISRVATNNITLLSNDEWKEYGIDIGDFCEQPEKLPEAVAHFGSIQVGAAATFGKVVECKREKCLELGSSIVDFQDLDFDGKKELIFNHSEAGQRRVDQFEVHSLEPSEDGTLVIDPLYDSGNSQPLNQIDAMTEIYPDARRIVIHGSGGACGSWSESFEKPIEERSSFKLVHRTEWQTNLDTDECFRAEYSVSESVTGIRKYKMLSRTLDKQ